jgi:mitofusin
MVVKMAYIPSHSTHTSVQGTHSTDQDEVIQSGSLLYPNMKSHRNKWKPSSDPQRPADLTDLISTSVSEQQKQQRDFADKRRQLLLSIQSCKALLEELCDKSIRKWTVKYPVVSHQSSSPPATPTSRSPPSSPLSTSHPLLPPLEVLQLDVKSMGSRYGQDLVGSFDDAAVAVLLDSKLEHCMQHLQKLHGRISDTTSKVLVTGDLNAGKSTFVNAILRRDVMPHDQQPCTGSFCEVVDASNNNGVEEVHAIRNPAEYRRDKPETYCRIPLADFHKSFLSEEENDGDFILWKIYCRDGLKETGSLLNNGLVDVTLIDSPGLNRDSIKTMAVFAQQEEIDAVIFVVNAENHFTLSVRQRL